MLKRCIATVLTLLFCMAPAAGLLVPVRAAHQNRDFANVVLFAYFSDEPNKNYFNSPAKADPAKSAAQKLMELYDGQQGRSFRQYMNTISGGQFQVHNIFPQWDGQTLTAFELPFTRQQAQNGSIDYSILSELAKNVPAVQGQTLDYDGDGAIDNLSVVLLGEGGNATGSPPSLYPHQNTLPAGLHYSGKQVASYNMLNTDRLLDSTLPDGSGVICHEFLHTLGYPDLYTRDSAVPVGCWDIMAQSSRYLSYPLAYLRAHFTGWTQLPQLDASAQNVSICAPGEAGTQAYQIRSPRNPYEVFVVEMRRQTSPYGEDTLDSRIGGTGLIVYRVDTTVDELSNYFGSTGVYVFRPQSGQNGYVQGNERATVANAFLSAESGRTSIGSADMSAGLAQGALTFSDGTNSGIVISDVSSAQNGSMTFSVTIPPASSADLWQDAAFPTHTGAALAQAPIRGQMMAVGYDQLYTGNQLQLYAFADPEWAPVGTPLTQENGFGQVTLTSLRDTPVVAWRSSEGTLHLAMLNGEDWKELGSLPDVNDYSIAAQSGTLHLAYVSGGYAQAGYATATKRGLFREGRCASGRNFGNPKAAVTDQGKVYLAFRDSTNDDSLLVYLAEEDGAFSRLSGPGNADTYDLVAVKDDLLLAMGGQALTLKKLNGDTWQEITSLPQGVFEPRIAAGADALFVLTAPLSVSDKGLRVYRLTDGTLVPEGEQVDKGGDAASLIAFGDRLFTTYRLDGNIRVKYKGPSEQTDKLLSLSVTPPALTSYHKGDSVSTQGLRVFANYTSGPKELASQDYQLTGFDTQQAGERQATVSYQGLRTSFVYTVFEAPLPTAQPTAAPTAQPTAAPTAQPTAAPTAQPTAAPTAQPTAVPTAQPTAVPTAQPTAAPTAQPTAAPTAQPTAAPTAQPTAVPTAQPTAAPTAQPTAAPTAQPTAAPTAQPTAAPTAQPTAAPTAQPTAAPTAQPTAAPTVQPTAAPTAQPTAAPTAQPTAAPTAQPTAAPTAQPTAAPTVQPTAAPTAQSTAAPTAQPTAAPAANPSTPSTPAGTSSAAATTIPAATIPPSSAVIRPVRPTAAPTAAPTAQPTAQPTATPTAQPSEEPASDSSEAPASSTPANAASGVKSALPLVGLAGLGVCGALALFFFWKRR